MTHCALLAMRANNAGQGRNGYAPFSEASQGRNRYIPLSKTGQGRYRYAPCFGTNAGQAMQAIVQNMRSLANSSFPLKRWAVVCWVLVSLCGCVPSIDVRVQAVPVASTLASSEAVAEPVEQAGAPGVATAEAALTALVTYLVLLAELSGALVIGVGVVRGLLRFIPHILQRQPTGETYSEDIRLQLGKSLALALEFELGADILKTAVAPTLTVIAQLAAIAALRTFLNYFLDRELREVEQRRSRQEAASGPRPASVSSSDSPNEPERPAAP